MLWNLRSKRSKITLIEHAQRVENVSDSHVGAVLEQEGENDEMQPLAFYSKRLPPFKQIRSIFYKELRGVYLSLKHF